MTQTLKTLVKQASRLPEAAQDRLARRWLRDVESQAVDSAETAPPGDLAPRAVTERVAGLGKGTVELSADFDDPLPDPFWLGGE